MNVLDLPLEKQKESAKACGFSNFEEWRAWVMESNKAFEEERKKRENAPPMSAEEKAAKIKAVRENPNGIYHYRRVWGDDTLTVEDVVEEIESW